MKTIQSNTIASLNFLQQIISQGGPETMEYDALNEVFDNLSKQYKSGALGANEIEILQNGFGDECLENTLHGHIKTKPFGYAGDFLIIDKIYREQVTSDHRFAKWDTFWNCQSAAKAVRNRKDYFLRTMSERLATNDQLQLLNVASGPARDLAELYQQVQPGTLNTVCVEADKNAIAYAKNLNKAHLDKISFIHQNIFRFNTNEQFDIVWSAGLFDYFDDAVFVKLLRKFMSWIKPGGEVIIGNFSTCNPSRNYMELVGDWYLKHRSNQELIDMAVEAGAAKHQVTVGQELEGVNLFLHVIV